MLNLTVYVVSTVLNLLSAVFMSQKLNCPGCSEEIKTVDHSSVFTVYCYMIRLKWKAIIRQCRKYLKIVYNQLEWYFFKYLGSQLYKNKIKMYVKI